MTFVTQFEARDRSKRIMRDILEAYKFSAQDDIEQSRLSSMGPKKLAKEIIKQCKTKNHYVFLEDRYREKTSWQILWGEWSLGYKNNRKFNNAQHIGINEYDRLLFDLTYNGKWGSKFKFFYIVLSKHAFLRMITRFGSDIHASSQVFNFLKDFTKQTVAAGLSMLNGNNGRIILVNGLYLPLVMEKGVNVLGKDAISITIKTVMPRHYKINKDDLIDDSLNHNSLFQYMDLFPSNL